MISAANTATISFIDAYNARGGLLSRFHTDPAQENTAQVNITDKVSLSATGIDQSQTDKSENATDASSNATAGIDTKNSQPNTRNKKSGAGDQTLTPAEQKEVQQLKTRDQEVKTHEMAHLASAGQYARGGPTYTYQQGPDGLRYAIGGEVPIDISKGKTPQETIQKMETIKRAAMAPADPSAADRSIAAAATAMEAQAREQLQNAQEQTAQQQKQPAETSTASGGQPSPDPTSNDSSRRSLSFNIIA